jgi:hypothetical protein
MGALIYSGSGFKSELIKPEAKYLRLSIADAQKLGLLPDGVQELLRRSASLAPRKDAGQGMPAEDVFDPHSVLRLKDPKSSFDPQNDGQHVEYLLKILELDAIEPAQPITLPELEDLEDSWKQSTDAPKSIDVLPVSIRGLKTSEEVRDLAEKLVNAADSASAQTKISVHDIIEQEKAHKLASATPDAWRTITDDEEPLLPLLRRATLALARTQNATGMVADLEVPAPSRTEVPLPSNGLGSFKAVTETRIWDRFRADETGFDSMTLERAQHIEVEVPTGCKMWLIKEDGDKVTDKIVLGAGKTRLEPGRFTPGEYRVVLWTNPEDPALRFEDKRKSGSVYLPELRDPEEEDLSSSAGLKLVADGRALARFEAIDAPDGAAGPKGPRVGIYAALDDANNPTIQLPKGAQPRELAEHSEATIELPHGVYRLPGGSGELRIYDGTRASIIDSKGEETSLLPMFRGFGTATNTYGAQKPQFVMHNVSIVSYHITPIDKQSVLLRKDWNGEPAIDGLDITAMHRIA